MTPTQYTLCATLARWLPGSYGDAVAALVDRASELASELDSTKHDLARTRLLCTRTSEQRDERREAYFILQKHALALESRIESLKDAVRKVAAERDAERAKLREVHDRMSVATGIRYEADYISAPGPWNDICKAAEENRKDACELQEWKYRVEQAESRPIIADRAATPALVRLAFAARKIRALMSEGGGIQSHAHRVPGIWDPDNGHDRAGKPCEQCATVLEFRRAVDELSEPDLVPVHPAVMRVVGRGVMPLLPRGAGEG